MRWNVRFLLIVLCFLLCGISLVKAHHCSDIPTHIYVKGTIHEQDYMTRSLNVHTYSDGEIKIDSDIPGLDIEPSKLSLSVDEELPIKLKFNGSSVGTGAYVGLISVTGEKTNYAVSAIFEVESEYKTYDMNLEIPPLYTTIRPEEKIVFQATLFNLAVKSDVLPAPTEASLKFIVYAPDGRILKTDEENIIITDTTRITKSFVLPESADCEEYVLVGIIEEKKSGSVGIATQSFKVTLPPNTLKEKITSFFSVTTIIIFLLSAILIGVLIIIVKNIGQNRVNSSRKRN